MALRWVGRQMAQGINLWPRSAIDQTVPPFTVTWTGWRASPAIISGAIVGSTPLSDRQGQSE